MSVFVVDAISGRAWGTGAIIEVSLVDALVSIPSMLLIGVYEFESERRAMS